MPGVYLAVVIYIWGTATHQSNNTLDSIPRQKSYVYCPGIARAFSDGVIFASSL